MGSGSGRTELIVAAVYAAFVALTTLSSDKIPRFGRSGQHDEAVGCQDGQMPVHMGVPDGREESRVEVSDAPVLGLKGEMTE